MKDLGSCPECGELLPLHRFRCPESLPPLSLWNTQHPEILFGSASETVVPFGQAPFAKAFDRDLVASHLAIHPPAVELERLDPRELLATQPGVQRPAVEHYLGPFYRELGVPFAEPHSPGNKYPVVYRYVRPLDGRREVMILAGHHRSTAALLQGRRVLARVVEGPVRLKGSAR